MSGILELTLLLVGILLILVIVLWVARSYHHKDQNKSGRYAAQTKDMACYIKLAKMREQEAWTDVMTVMGEDRDLSSKYLGTSIAARTQQQQSSTQHIPSKLAAHAPLPLNDLQKAFFSFWRIPENKIPETSEAANRFIEAYKAKLRTDGYTHRVRRWGRLEILMGRFCATHDVKKLNQKCKAVGIDKPILDVLLAQMMSLLGKEVLQWKDVANDGAYQIVVKYLDKSYPQLTLANFRKDSLI